eukprot:7381529-Prymnesium_polylepis.1
MQHERSSAGSAPAVMGTCMMWQKGGRANGAFGATRRHLLQISRRAHRRLTAVMPVPVTAVRQARAPLQHRMVAFGCAMGCGMKRAVFESPWLPWMCL